MGARADYNLAQAVAMVNLIAKGRDKHEAACEHCLIAYMRRNEPDFYAEQEFCPDGLTIYRNYTKWKRRCTYAAKREGKHITV